MAEFHKRLNFLVAGAGFEPTTFGLRARRATELLHPASRRIYVGASSRPVKLFSTSPPRSRRIGTEAQQAERIFRFGYTKNVPPFPLSDKTGLRYAISPPQCGSTDNHRRLRPGQVSRRQAREEPRPRAAP